ncbi:MAG: hypothetical protein O9275_21735, partial [Microcystis sp. LE19-196.1B]|nr:hypothetical protein [Microcystis sp. LE19-196.1B]
ASETIRDDIIKATRNIFTVINKTAKSIDKQTQLLLDDSKISALIPRKILEEKVLEDKYVKWSSTNSLNQADPYLTTLNLISECTMEILKDSPQALKKSFNSPNERQMALKDYYDSHPNLSQIGTKAVLNWFFNELQPFKDWISQLNYLDVDVPIQPDQPQLKPSQKAAIKRLRQSSILYTVLGQKILFFAVSRYLLRVRKEYRITATLSAISDSIKKMDQEGFFQRNQPHWSNIIVQPNENLSILTKGSGADKCVELVKIILSDTSDGVRELIKKTKEEISPDVNWNEHLISKWKKEFHVILPRVDLIDEQLQESSESEDLFSEVREKLDSFEEEENEFAKIEYDGDIFQENE